MLIKIATIFLVISCLCFSFSAPIALLSGIFLAFVFSNPYGEISKKLTCHLLALSVIGLGAGINLKTIAQTGMEYFGLTIISIFITLLFGFLLGKKLKIAKGSMILISVGTAICGGSAIAAVAPAIRAKSSDISVALGVVFLLNSVALITFPAIASLMNLSQEQFGLWSALAIHDTSSVVGATSHYGEKALEVGTIVKLVRSLWIIPLALIFSITARNQNLDNLEPSNNRKKFPWFILGFIAMAALTSYSSTMASFATDISSAAKQLLIVAIFFLGTSLTKEVLSKVGLRPFLHGVSLWIIAASFSLAQIMMISS